MRNVWLQEEPKANTGGQAANQSFNRKANTIFELSNT